MWALHTLISARITWGVLSGKHAGSDSVGLGGLSACVSDKQPADGWWLQFVGHTVNSKGLEGLFFVGRRVW